MKTLRRAGIIATGSALPSRVVTNEDLIAMSGIDSTPEWIEEHTGIRERRYAERGETTSDYATRAAFSALEQAHLSADVIDEIILATTTPDRLCPASATAVQHNIGAPVWGGAYDLHAGCSGFVYALSNAICAVECGRRDNVLVIGADLLTRITNWTDRGTCMLFGDGAGAVIVSAVNEPYGFLSEVLYADGSQIEHLLVPCGGSLSPMTPEDIYGWQDKLWMNGKKVFALAIRLIPELIGKTTDAAGIAISDLDEIILHQANGRIIDTAVERVEGMMAERTFVNVDRYANTSAGSIPIALDEWYNATADSLGKLLGLFGFGAGFTLGGTILRWGITKNLNAS